MKKEKFNLTTNCGKEEVTKYKIKKLKKYMQEHKFYGGVILLEELFGEELK